MKTALITGVAGQDGLYLAELLLQHDYKVVGAVKDVEAARERVPRHLAVELVQWDTKDEQRMADVLLQHRPAEVYNFAAYASGSRMHEDPVGIGDVNGLAVARLLEAIKRTNSHTRFCQASSSIGTAVALRLLFSPNVTYFGSDRCFASIHCVRISTVTRGHCSRLATTEGVGGRELQDLFCGGHRLVE